MTVLNIANNNNTRLIIFPFFSSRQLSSVIASMNILIAEETSLSSVITTLYLRSAFLMRSYKVLYYVFQVQL